MDIQTCVQCGTSAYPNDLFCGNCGTKLQFAGLPIWANDYIPLPSEKKARRRTEHKSKNGKKRLARRLGFIKLIFVATVITFGGVPAPDTYAHLQTDDHDGLTILLMGVDARDDEEIDIGVRPDSLSVLHLDPESGSCRILGIPRDSRVELPNHGLTKINHALALGGIAYQVEVVENFLGIPIDHYGLVDFHGLIGVVDAVGGITVRNPYAFAAGGFYFAEGTIDINGTQALAFSRFRGGPDGDFGRMERQQIVIRGVLAELSGADAVQAVPDLMQAAENHFRTDFSVIDLIRFANQYRQSCTSATLETRSLIGANEMLPDPVFNMYLWYVVHDMDDIAASVRWLMDGGE